MVKQINAELAGARFNQDNVLKSEKQRLQELIMSSDDHLGMGLTNSKIIGECIGGTIKFVSDSPTTTTVELTINVKKS